MAKNWVVVADSASARIFSVATPLAPLEELETMEHPAGRLRAQNIDADRPGRSFQSAGSMRHGMEREVDPKKQAAMNFAKTVAERLETARAQGQVERLILVAAPEFLGLLRQHLGAEARQIVDSDFALNLAGMTPVNIRKHLPEKLFATIQAG